jgi:fumarylacetoacetate (FAA) hydrolase family protein
MHTKEPLMELALSAADFLPEDGYAGTLVGRAWLPGAAPGPAPVTFRRDGVFDLSERWATMADLLEQDDPAALVRATPGRRVAELEGLLADTARRQRDPAAPFLLADAGRAPSRR